MMVSLFSAIMLLLVSSISCDMQWSDPFDMTGDSKNPPPKADKVSKEKISSSASSEEFVSEPQKQQTGAAADAKGIPYDQMYKQLILSLWNPITKANKRYQTTHLEANVRVSERAQHVIEDYLERGSGSTAEVNDVLANVFSNYRPTGGQATGDFFWSDSFVDAVLPLIPIVVIFLFGLLVWVHLTNSWLRLFWPVFYLSWVWTWVYLYKTELAKRRAKILKSTNVSSCVGSGNLAWWNALGRYIHSFVSVLDDDCTDIQRIYSVDPWLEVSPTMALTHMIVKTFVDPAATVAEAIAKFFRVIIKDLPVLASFLVIVIVIIFVLVFLLCLFGYRIRVPFLFAIEPTPRPEAPQQIPSPDVSSMIRDMDRRHSQVMERLEEMSITLSPGRRLRRINSEVQIRERRRTAVRPRYALVNAAGDTRSGTASSESEGVSGEVLAQPTSSMPAARSRSRPDSPSDKARP